MKIIPSFRNLLFGTVLFCLANGLSAQQPVDYVNPYMGNISHLLVPTFPTIHLPNSFLRVYPERGDFTGNFTAWLAFGGNQSPGKFGLQPKSVSGQ